MRTLVFVILAVLLGCRGQSQDNVHKPKGGGTMLTTFRISSSVFEAEGFIPSRYTCDGENISPPLKWVGAPVGTKSFALIFDDPDAPAGTWVHWVLYNLPATADSLPEQVPTTAVLENQAFQGTSSFRQLGYGGPCPPGGTHRYFFKLYALDAMLPLKSGATKEELLGKMEGHILAKAGLMGRYQRQS